ncbi:RNA helicase [Trapelia coarctata]|nr:RNA helicase [Trapelia coarctata]
MPERLKDPGFRVNAGLLEDTASTQLAEFKTKYLRTLKSWKGHQEEDGPSRILDGLRQAFIDNGEPGIDAQLRFALQGYVANSKFTKSDLLNQARLADLRYPFEWYPEARRIQRKIHLHVGPTNSGKTYHALKRLETASSGMYAGPLRLLAHEVFRRLNAFGKPCNLITGDERVLVESEDVKMSSCTVEMVPVAVGVEVAVIDEIQMIGHEERGWAWTQALLGIPAQELHLCGEERVVPVIRELAAAMGDSLEVHRYQRLSPLRTMSTSLDGDLSKLQKGDCVVTFSRMQIHALKKDIEKRTCKRVAVVYGSLPPEIRAQQAKLFNDPDNDYDILVASDAIGMGLNLSIKRIIFETTSRHNGEVLKTLSVSDIKQIAGRAGRYRTAPDMQTRIGAKQESKETIASAKEITDTPATNLGLVTTLEKMDLPIVRNAMQSEAEPLTKIGISPPDHIILRFSTYFPPETPFSYILLRLYEISRMHPRFQLCSLRSHIGVADMIQPVKELTVADRIVMCSAPVDLRDPRFPNVVLAFAKCIATQSNGALLEIPALNISILDEEVSIAHRIYLERLESLHKALVLYLWLSYRFIGVFTSQDMAFHVKRLVEERIDSALSQVSQKEETRARLKRFREQAMLHALQAQMALGGNESQSSDSDATTVVNAEDSILTTTLPEDTLEQVHASASV